MSEALLIRNMPDPDKVREAPLPVIYQGAKVAISECVKIDQCQEWADKALALASYARQAGDEELINMARAIQGRAIKRCGDLLREIEKATGAHLKKEGALPLSRKQAAHDAGLSVHQHKTAIRVSNIPTEEFERAIESPKPPTVTKLAEMGRQPRPKPIVDLGSIAPEEYQAATKLMGMLDGFTREAASVDIDQALAGLKPHEWPRMIQSAVSCLEWIESFLNVVKEKGECTQTKI